MTASNRNIEDEIATIELYESLLENYDMESRPYFGGKFEAWDILRFLIKTEFEM